MALIFSLGICYLARVTKLQNHLLGVSEDYSSDTLLAPKRVALPPTHLRKGFGFCIETIPDEDIINT